VVIHVFVLFSDIIVSASEMTCIVSSGALNSTHSLTHPDIIVTLPRLNLRKKW